MFSFAKIATFAALAFGTLASAVPASVAVPDAGELDTRASQDISTILTNLNNDLKAPLGQLNGMTARTATVDNVNTQVQAIKTMIQSATTAIGSASGNGNGNPLMLIGTTINSVMTAANKAHSVSTDQANVLVVIQLLDPVLAALVALVLKLVAGLLTIVIGLLVGLLGAVTQLILGLDFVLLAGVLLI
ncbi:hypothetical protein PENSPDRAFT_649490 [Peniophora sp. CONT]|nr:hypothetical protein PENSPDRAFT_649490 [Peniophora sp. CONT]